MNLSRLALRRIAGSPFRSGLIFMCLALVAAATLWSTLILRGAQTTLQLSVANMHNPGVDLVALPRVDGYSRTGLGNVDLPGLLNQVRSTQGVERASPQLLVARLTGSAYCSATEMLVIALEPETDFWVLHRSETGIAGRLAAGEALAGSLISVPGGSATLEMAGFPIKLAGRLAPTGTSLDRSLFIGFDTYQQMADQEQPLAAGLAPMDLQAAPYILVKIAPGSSPDEVGARLLKNIRGISVFSSDAFFNIARGRMTWLLENIPALLAGVWLLASLWIALIFFLALHERRREIAVLRALGCSRRSVLQSLVLEGALLALAGSLAGILLSLLAYWLTRSGSLWSTGLLPDSSPPALLLLALESLGLALASVIVAAFFPAWWINRRDPAEIMRG